VINAIFLPVAIISGTFFTPEAYPGFLHAIAVILPLTHFTELTRNVMVGHDHLWDNAGAVAVVAVWGAIGLVAALRGFRWQPQEA
jgi:ABC-2 type transport system permease protein